MEGRWLEKLGFPIGTHLVVEYEEGSIRIRPFTEEETAAIEEQNFKRSLPESSRNTKLQDAVWQNNTERSQWSQKRIVTMAQILQHVRSAKSDPSAGYPGIQSLQESRRQRPLFSPA